MVLSRSINPEDIIRKAREKGHLDAVSNKLVNHSSTPYASRYASNQDVPKYRVPGAGIDPGQAYQLVHDELEFDGRPNLNMASFVHTYMEPEADKLIMENINKNLADGDEYPALMSLHSRCISMISSLWKVNTDEKPIGSATTGSSEAIMLGGLAMKRRWQQKREKEGKSTAKPNMIFGANAHCAVEKFARYFEVEARICSVSKDKRYVLDGSKVLENVDENTIGVFIILGSTYTGHFEDVQGIAASLDEYEARTGNDVPIHVDGASGAMVAPFVYPDFKWSFELPRVKSINTSGHKYGLTYVGLGWIMFRDESFLPKELIFQLHYLGATEETFTLNFSRPGAQVIAQYFSFLRLGFEGYKQIAANDLVNARLLSTALENTGYYVCASDVHRKRGVFSFDPKAALTGVEDPNSFNEGLPVVAFHFTDDFRKQYPHVKQATVSVLMRVRGWIIPNYPLPPHEEQTEILRVVIRQSFSAETLDKFLNDIINITEQLMNSDEMDLEAFAGTSHTSVERQHGTVSHQHDQDPGQDHRHKMGHRRKKGVFAYPC